MRITLRFALVCTLALLGVIYHKIKPKRRELSDEHYI
jgi:hypothetical protein